MAFSSRLAVSGQISVIIWSDIWYYPAGYPVLSGRISGIIWPDIRYYLAGYPVRQLAGYPAGYPNPAVKNCRISGIRLSGFVLISRISGIRLSGKITIRYIPIFKPVSRPTISQWRKADQPVRVIPHVDCHIITILSLLWTLYSWRNV